MDQSTGWLLSIRFREVVSGEWLGPIAMLQGKVNAQNQLLVSSVVSAADALSASIDSATKFTDAVLIPVSYTHLTLPTTSRV